MISTLRLLPILGVLIVALCCRSVDASAQSLIKDIRPGASGSGAGPFFSLGTNMLFRADDGSSGAELWITDGTDGGTTMVKDINPGAGGSTTAIFASLGSVLIFVADDGTNGNEIWSTDGSEVGTELVKNINPTGASTPLDLTPFGGEIIFRADDGTNGAEVWKTDGTSLGTALLKDINPGAGGSFPGGFTSFGGFLFFGANDGVNGAELWKTDGTEIGTTMVKDINSSGSSGPAMFTPLNGLMCFSAIGSSGFELYATNGTTSGTDLVMDINPGSSNHSFPSNLTVVGPLIFFTANDGTNGSELWKTDCTSGNTAMVKDINPGSSGSSPAELIEFNSQLVFRANDGTSGTELWISDGTGGGTTMIKDIQPGSGSSLPSELFVLPNGTAKQAGGTLYFRANDGTDGVELWRSDGTAGGTMQVSDYNSGPSNSFPLRFAELDGKLMFVADNGTAGQEPTILDPALPVELISIDAIADGPDVVIVWATASEQSNSGFEVQYQRQPSIWEDIAFVAGAGYSSSRREYEYRVSEIGYGTHVFRLKQVDFDGTFAYSLAVEVVLGVPLAYDLHDAYPNPFSRLSTISYTLPVESDVTIVLRDAIGREVRHLDHGVKPAGVHTIALDAESLAAGLYYYRLHTANYSSSKRVVILR